MNTLLFLVLLLTLNFINTLTLTNSTSKDTYNTNRGGRRRPPSPKIFSPPPPSFSPPPPPPSFSPPPPPSFSPPPPSFSPPPPPSFSPPPPPHSFSPPPPPPSFSPPPPPSFSPPPPFSFSPPPPPPLFSPPPPPPSFSPPPPPPPPSFSPPPPPLFSPPPPFSFSPPQPPSFSPPPPPSFSPPPPPSFSPPTPSSFSPPPPSSFSPPQPPSFSPPPPPSFSPPPPSSFSPPPPPSLFSPPPPLPFSPPPPSPSRKDYHHMQVVISWPPEYCRTAPKSCIYATPPHNFYIHGLWPANAYGYTLSEAKQNTTLYELYFDSLMACYLKDLNIYWPGLHAQPRKRQWVYQWNKHGTCAEPFINYEQYFIAAIEFGKRYNTIFKTFKSEGIVPNNSNPYTRTQIVKAVRKKFPEIQNMNIYIKCDNDSAYPSNIVHLRELYICFSQSGITPISCPMNTALKGCPFSSVPNIILRQ